MRASNLRRLVGPWAGAFVALLAPGLVAPVSARAGCAHPAGARPALTHFERLDLAGAIPASPVRSPDELPTSPKPCVGATCSGSHALPVTPAPRISSRIDSPWGLLIPRLPAVDPGSVACLGEDRPLLLPHLAFGIFRPPRPPRVAPMA